MEGFEKLGVFYLGRTGDPQPGGAARAPLLYDSRDLTTHAVCLGMTGSGKTGLCLALLEEAALDGIPAIAIDPKGDLGNLLLSFPELRPADFLPWVEESEAARQGISTEILAARAAATWKKGLAEWGQDGDRIARLRSSADFAIYTPGSSAGLPLAVLKSFDAPPPDARDGDALRERIGSTVAGLLALLGLESDPVKSRETVFLSCLLQEAWQRGEGLDLPSLIRRIQSPSFDRVGVMDLESFYPAKERLSLSLALNNLLASPGFASWMEGETLDIARLLWAPGGKPRVSILSIAHLSDAERMFFVTLLLNEVIAWMRRQSGTSSLRAILYMDEVFGYFPPTANPPSKTPLLTLMKQARAFGLGVVLASQNPVDLDYKGLSNAGTWLLGRLQTERDKARVLDGLEGASAQSGGPFDRQAMEKTLAGLQSRFFVLQNVHEERPVVFESRWCLSFLRGPLTRAQIQTLMEPRKGAPSPAAADTSRIAATTGPARLSAAVPIRQGPAGHSVAAIRPVLPPGIHESFLAWRGGARSAAGLVYRAALIGAAKVHFTDAKSGVDCWQDALHLALLQESTLEQLWDGAETLESEPDRDAAPAEGCAFAPLPAAASRAKSYDEWKTSFAETLYRSCSLTLFRCAPLKQVSRPGEPEADFRARLAASLREKRDSDVQALRERYAAKLASLQERIRRAEQKISVEQSQYDAQKMQTAISAGAAILGALFGRKAFSAGNLGRTTTAMRGAGRAVREKEDVGRAAENADQLHQELATLAKRIEGEIAAIQEGPEAAALAFEPLTLRPRKSDIQVEKVALVWTPWETGPHGELLRRF